MIRIRRGHQFSKSVLKLLVKSLCAQVAGPPLSYRRLILTFNLLSLIPFPQLPVYNAIFLTEANLPHAYANKRISNYFYKCIKESYSAKPLQPIHSQLPPWTIPRHPSVWTSHKPPPMTDQHTYNASEISGRSTHVTQYISQTVQRTETKPHFLCI